MQSIYTEEYAGNVSRQAKRRLWILFAVVIPLLGIFIWAMIARIEWLAMVSACLAGCAAVFIGDLFCAPVYRYRSLIRSASSNRSHTRSLEFSRLEPDISVVEGVPRRSLIFLGDPDKHGSRDMLLYWDNAFPLPELSPGSFYDVTFTGKTVIDLRPGDPSSRP